MPLILLLPVMTKTLILSLTEMLMMSWLVYQVVYFYLYKNHKVMFLMMIWMKMKMVTMIWEWSIMLLPMMEEKTLLLQSICPDYQPVLALQMLVQVLLLIFPLFLGMD